MQQQLIISLLQDLRAQGTTVLVATHSPEIASALRGRIIGLQDGAVMGQPAGIPRPQPSAPKAVPKPAAASVDNI
jgi:ABC-type lipoprotein export system ATPase subunit